MIDESLKNRFLGKFVQASDDECWEWQASTAGNGYGQVKLTGQRKQEYAHRISYMLFNGDIPEGHSVCHKCDNPKCVNPSHLFIGTQADNLQDMAKKGRSTYGMRNAQAKLNEDDVKEIRVLLNAGISQTRIARRYGVHQVHISRIKTGKRRSKS